MSATPKRRWRTLAVAIPIAALGCVLAVATASAEQYPPAPQGDDIAFLQLGSVGEMESLELFRAAAASGLLEPGEKTTFRRLAKQADRSWREINAALGEDALSEEDFAVRFPESVLRSRAETIALGARFARLLTGLYMSGVQSVNDPPTRLLIGRHLAVASRNLTLLRQLRGGCGLKLVKPLSVEYVGIQLDRYLTVPGTAPGR